MKTTYPVLPASLLSLICAVVSPAQGPGDIPTLAPQEQVSSFGMVGVASGQTGRLNVVNSGTQSPAPAACKVRLQLVDEAGEVLKEVTIDNLLPGRAASLDLARPAPSSADSTPLRVQMRGVVRTNNQAGPLPLAPAFPVQAGCTLIPTLEVFDNSTGRTAAILSGTQIVAVSETALLNSPSASR
jgi:hypothetical protein